MFKRDKRFAALIKKHGPPKMGRRGSAFQALVRSIIYQQVSGKAAATILARFVALFNIDARPDAGWKGSAKFPTPEEVQAMPLEKLRAVGLSRQKASYIKDVAEKFANGTIKHRVLARMSNAEVEAHLLQIKGVGVWTVHMFLIFTLGRHDVLPLGYLGIQRGFQIVYGLKAPPSRAQMERLARPWRAHASAASWYLWRAADEAKVILKTSINL